ncbi:MAG: ARMT1-like domain-containing protein [Actinobacteria bacterium]|nr:ARMT1-like domain-containing protein [Actinomycetota bacterium]
MKIHIDCIPCHVRQAFSAIRMLTNDEKVIKVALRESLEIASKFESFDNIFVFYNVLQKNLRKFAPGIDPYENFKKKFNKLCLHFADDLEKMIKNSHDSFETGLRIALAGNSIDVMQGRPMNEDVLMEAIKDSLSHKLDKSKINSLRKKVITAEKILYIGDNAGEIVFDKIFIEVLNKLIDENKKGKKGTITYVVRGGPTLNDSTMEDAIMVGMDKVVKVITNGVDIPSVYLPFCSEEFRKVYYKSDLVISKGMGNLESLINEDKDIYFLLKIKCSPIAVLLGNKYMVDDIIVETPKKEV